MIGLLRERGFEVSAGSQNKHYVHGLGLEAEKLKLGLTRLEVSKIWKLFKK